MCRYIYLLCGKGNTFFFNNMQIPTITHPKMILLKRDFGFTEFGESIFVFKLLAFKWEQTVPHCFLGFFVLI